MANLLLPSEKLCNQGFDLEIDGGSKNLPGFHSDDDEFIPHFRFVCFPCAIIREDVATGLFRDETTSSVEKVEKFSFAFVFDSRAKVNVESFFLIEANMSKALLVAEDKFDHLSIQVDQICSYLAKLKKLPIRESGTESAHFGTTKTDSNADADYTTNLGEVMEAIHFNCSLAQNMRQVFDQLQASGSARILIESCLACHVTTYPMQPITPPKPYEALALFRDPVVIQAELPIDCAVSTRRVVDVATPHKSLKDLMLELCLPMQHLSHICQHLVFWRVGKIVDKIQSYQTYSVSSTAELDLKAVSDHFVAKFPQCPVTLAEVLALFGQHAEVRHVRESFYLAVGQSMHSPPFDGILDWLVIHDVITRVRRYFFFLPLSAKAWESKNAYGRMKVVMNNEALKSGRPPCLSITHETDESLAAVLPERTSTLLVEVLRMHLSGYPLSDFSDDDLVSIYLYLREQQLLAAMQSEENEWNGRTVWEDTVEQTVLTDIESMCSDGLEEHISGALLFMLDFICECIRRRRVDEASIEHELAKLHCDVENPYLVPGVELFNRLILNRLPGLFSQSILSYEC